jgi:nucleoside-diphosphate-sugar epimerase
LRISPERTDILDSVAQGRAKGEAMAKKVVVTGAAGYLGSVLCGRLLEAGYAVTAVDNLTYGRQSLFQYCAHPGFDFACGDVRDRALMAGVLDGADAVIPLAAIVGAPACDRDPILARSVNTDAIAMLLELRDDDQLIVYPNTNSGYGTKSGDIFCTEDAPLDPITLYGRTKCAAEAALLEAPNTIVLRLATVFGVSQRMRIDLLVNHFVYAAVTDGYLVIFEKDFKRNYVHIRDVADGFAHCLEHREAMAGRAYNVGLDAANMSKAELAETVKHYVPELFIHYSEIKSDPDKRNYIVSNQRLREAGFEASRSIEAGIRELLKAYRMLGRRPFANV